MAQFVTEDLKVRDIPVWARTLKNYGFLKGFNSFHHQCAEL